MLVWLLDVESQSVVEGSLERMTKNHLVRARRTWLEGFQQRQGLSLGDQDSMVWTCGRMPGPNRITFLFQCERVLRKARLRKPRFRHFVPRNVLL